MTKKEKELFFYLCETPFHSLKKVKRLLCEGAATSAVLGCLFSNRMAAVAYRNLNDNGLLGYVDREFTNSIRDAHAVGEKRQAEYFKRLEELSQILEATGARYALLKGAWLCGLYPSGCRLSNDIDILVLPEDVDLITRVLSDRGYRRGYIRAGEFVEADRAQIIEARMTRGEIVPLVCSVDSEFMRFCEIDVNISLDYKNADKGAKNAIELMLNRTRLVPLKNFEIRTLDKYDFFLHLCAHLYKEVSTLPWVKMKKDMTFYKFCDIYLMMHKIEPQAFYRLSDRARFLGLERELRYCLIAIKEFFGFQFRSPDADMYYEYDDKIMNFVVAPQESAIYRYTENDLKKRFFDNDRQRILERTDWRWNIEKA